MATVGDPSVLVLDEPFAFVDEFFVDDFQVYLRNYVDSSIRPKMILISSQRFVEVERIADGGFYISQSRMDYWDATTTKTERSVFEIEPEMGVVKETVDVLSGKGCAATNVGTKVVVSCAIEISMALLLAWLKDEGIRLRAIRDISRSPRKIFYQQRQV